MRHHTPWAAPWVCKLALFLACGAAQAEIYKWVDEQGRTHYSHNKADAERAKGSTQVRIREQAPVPVEPPSSYWDYLTDKSKQPGRTAAPPPEPESREPSDSAGTPATTRKRYDGTDDAARCEYALDVLSGRLRLANGERSDEHWLKTAKDDVARFCR